MEFLKHKAGLIVLIVSLVIIVAAVWYLMFGMQGGGSYEGGTLVEGINDMQMWNVTSTCDWRNVMVGL